MARIVCDEVTAICAPWARTCDDASGVVPSFVQWICAVASATDRDTDCGASNGPAAGDGEPTGTPGACRSLRICSGAPPMVPPAASVIDGVAVSVPSCRPATSPPGNVADQVCALPAPVSVPDSVSVVAPSPSVTDTALASPATPDTTTSSPAWAMLTDVGVLLV